VREKKTPGEHLDALEPFSKEHPYEVRRIKAILSEIPYRKGRKKSGRIHLDYMAHTGGETATR